MGEIRWIWFRQVAKAGSSQLELVPPYTQVGIDFSWIFFDNSTPPSIFWRPCKYVGVAYQPQLVRLPDFWSINSSIIFSQLMTCYLLQVKVETGKTICEIALWTNWIHTGSMQVCGLSWEIAGLFLWRFWGERVGRRKILKPIKWIKWIKFVALGRGMPLTFSAFNRLAHGWMSKAQSSGQEIPSISFEVIRADLLTRFPKSFPNFPCKRGSVCAVRCWRVEPIYPWMWKRPATSSLPIPKPSALHMRSLTA